MCFYIYMYVCIYTHTFLAGQAPLSKICVCHKLCQIFLMLLLTSGVCDPWGRAAKHRFQELGSLWDPLLSPVLLPHGLIQKLNPDCARLPHPN